jgi:hypothetical protein
MWSLHLRPGPQAVRRAQTRHRAADVGPLRTRLRLSPRLVALHSVLKHALLAASARTGAVHPATSAPSVLSRATDLSPYDARGKVLGHELQKQRRRHRAPLRKIQEWAKKLTSTLRCESASASRSFHFASATSLHGHD